MFIGKINRFLRDRIASIAPIFAVMVGPMVVMAGAATDIARHHNANQYVQQALDAAGLAAAREARLDPLASSDDLKLIAQNYFNAQLDTSYQLAMKPIELQPSGADFKLEVEGEMPTSFMRMIGRNSLELHNMSQVTASETVPVEMALVLDLSHSMAGSRLTTLQTAANDFVDSLVDPSSDEVKVSIVPFGSYINVGTANKDASWISVPPDRAVTQTTCAFDRSVCPLKMGTCTTDGKKTPCQQRDCTGIPLLRTCRTMLQQLTWHGCVYSRSSPYDIKDENYQYARIKGMVTPAANRCASEIVPLTNDADALKTSIASLAPRGNTYIPAGLSWGYRTLSSKAPFDQGLTPAETTNVRGIKAMVLMSDGENTLYKVGSGTHEQTYGLWGFKNKATQATKKACSFAKSQNVEIYTIAFEITKTDTKDLIMECASSPNHYYDATNAQELLKAFEAITGALKRELAVSA